MINSVSELPAFRHDGAAFDFPEIDFDSHTLVVGQWVYHKRVDYLASQKLVKGDAAAVMKLEIGLTNDTYILESFDKYSYIWGLYPKITAKYIMTYKTIL